MINKKRITLSGTGNSEERYIIRLHVHKGLQRGDETPDDVFLDNKCRDDFCDVRFKDKDGLPLKYYKHSVANAEIIKDNRLGKQNFILPDGSILMSDYDKGQGISISGDNAASWTKVYPGEGKIIFISSIGDCFGFTSISPTSGTHRLIRSDANDTNHTTWTAVGPDMSDVSGELLHTSIAEDADGNLYCGRYQFSDAIFLMKSVDRGISWIDITPSGFSAYQHVHGVHVDTNVSPNVIYAGLDSAAPIAIKSINSGGSWINTNCPVAGNFNQMISGDGFRLFSGEASVNGGYSIIRTTDDITYTPVLLASQSISGMQKIGNTIYAFGSTNGANGYAQVYISEDDGVTWKTIWFDNFWTDGATSAGLRYATPYGRPIGETTDQLLIGGLSNSNPKRFGNYRLLHGDDHYMALYFVEVKNFNADEDFIFVTCGNEDAEQSDNSIFSPTIQSGMLAWYNFNESSADIIALDASGKGNAATITFGGGSRSDSDGARAGYISPPILQPGRHLHFSGTTKVQINGSDSNPEFSFVKNFTYLTWIQFTQFDTTLRWIMGRGAHSTNPLAIELRTAGGDIQFRYHNGTTLTQNQSAANYRFIRSCLADGNWHMLACTLDDSTPPKLEWTIDSVDSGQITLDATPVLGTQRIFGIGMGSDGAQPFIGNLDNPQIYSPALTSVQRRQIFESKNLASVEPGIAAASDMFTTIIAPTVNEGPPRNNITRLTGESTVIDPAGTYQLEDTNAWRVVTGWTAGTANDFFDENGIPIPFTGQQALDAGIGPRLYCGLKGIGGYTVDQDAAANAKIIRTLKVPTYIDTLYYSDFQEMDWSASNE